MNRVCPVCETINTPGALVCGHCGSTFTSGRTLRINIADTKDGAEDIDITDVYADCLVFFIDDDETPIIVPKRLNRITIGRTVPGSERPTLDLMDYGAGMMGVSRIHASIEQVGHSIMLVDLQSTNGTWLNGKRLYPNAPTAIRTGDRIRLGDLVMRVFFHQEETNEQTLIFTHHPRTGINPDELSSQVNTLLTALGDLQHIVDHIHKKPRVDISINAIVVSKNQQAISVNVENIPDAAPLFQDIIEPWKAANSDFILQRSDDLQRAVAHLVYELMNAIDNRLSKDERDKVTQQMMPVLQGIVFSTLSLKQTSTRQEHYP